MSTPAPLPSPQPNDSRVAFPPTAWTLIHKVQRLPGAHRASALNALLKLYWKPLYAFARSKGFSPHESEDFVQDFLCRFVERDQIQSVDASKGRFRDFLIICARNLLIDRIRRGDTQSRKPERGLISFEELRSQDGDPFEPSDGDTPEDAFREAWRRELLSRAVEQVKAHCDRVGRQADFQVFVDYYLCTLPVGPTWKELATRYGLNDWRTPAHMADWVKNQLARVIRQEVGRYADGDDDIDSEVRDLLD